jgi:cardiolipin synthase
MDELLNSVYRLCKLVDQAKLVAFSREVVSTPLEDSSLLKGYFSNSKANIELDLLISAWKQSDISSDALMGMVRGAAAANELLTKEESIQLVWTGPITHPVPVRKTAQVLQGIINGAKETLFIVSFVSFNVPEIKSALKSALSRGVKVSILLESVNKKVGDSFSAKIQQYKDEFPGMSVYEWPRASRPLVGNSVAAVHAKCAVADSNRAFVTSANLTQAALDKNIEMGLLIEGGETPRKINDQLRALCDEEIIHLVDSLVA